MTTITAVNQHEVEVNSDGRIRRVSVLQLAAIDETLASIAYHATKNIGTVVPVISKQPRGTRPRNSVMHAVLQ